MDWGCKSLFGQWSCWVWSCHRAHRHCPHPARAAATTQTAQSPWGSRGQGHWARGCCRKKHLPNPQLLLQETGNSISQTHCCRNSISQTHSCTKQLTAPPKLVAAGKASPKLTAALPYLSAAWEGSWLVQLMFCSQEMSKSQKKNQAKPTWSNFSPSPVHFLFLKNRSSFRCLFLSWFTTWVTCFLKPY